MYLVLLSYVDRIMVHWDSSHLLCFRAYSVLPCIRCTSVHTLCFCAYSVLLCILWSYSVLLCLLCTSEFCSDHRHHPNRSVRMFFNLFCALSLTLWEECSVFWLFRKYCWEEECHSTFRNACVRLSPQRASTNRQCCY